MFIMKLSIITLVTSLIASDYDLYPESFIKPLLKSQLDDFRSEEYLNYKRLVVEDYFKLYLGKIKKKFDITTSCYIAHALPSEVEKIEYKGGYYEAFCDLLDASLNATGFVTYYSRRSEPSYRGRLGYLTQKEFKETALSRSSKALVLFSPLYKAQFEDTSSEIYSEFCAIMRRGDVTPSYFVSLLLEGDIIPSIPLPIRESHNILRLNSPRDFYRNFFRLLKERLMPTKASFINQLEILFFEQAQAILQGSMDEKISANFDEHIQLKRKQKEQATQMLSELISSRCFKATADTNISGVLENEELMKSLVDRLGSLNIPDLEQKAARGGSTSQATLGFCHYFGLAGAEKNHDKAIFFLTRAAEGNNSGAQGLLGIIYSEGEGERDYQKAADFFQRAANITYMPSRGLGGYYSSFPFLSNTKASPAEKKAQKEFKSMCMHNFAVLLYHGRGIEQDILTAFRIFNDAAGRGFSYSQYSMGVYKYENQEYAEAITWFEQAALQDYDMANYNLGICSFLGHGEKKDPKKAFRLILKAAKKNIPVAQLSISKMYFLGEGIDRNIETAIEWAEKINIRQISEVKDFLLSLYIDLFYSKKNPGKAFTWFYKIAEEDPVAQYYTGICYYNGDGIEKNLSKALEFIKKSAFRQFAPAVSILPLLSNIKDIGEIELGLEDQQVFSEVTKQFEQGVTDGISSTTLDSSSVLREVSRRNLSDSADLSSCPGVDEDYKDLSTINIDNILDHPENVANSNIYEKLMGLLLKDKDIAEDIIRLQENFQTKEAINIALRPIFKLFVKLNK